MKKIDFKKVVILFFIFSTTMSISAQSTGNIENLNWITSKTFDITGAVIASNKSYFDDLGKGVQSQSLDVKTGKIWASQTMYDAQGRPALQSLSAPINSTGDFLYNPNFIKKSNGATYTAADFESNIESPEPVGETANTLGWYYSNSNTNEPYQDITSRPFSRTIYSDLNPGAVRKVIGGNKINNEWKSGYAFSMPASEELSHSKAFGYAKYRNIKTIKTVSRDVHGEESVMFTDTDGKVLAAARVGEGYLGINTITISEQGFVDIHIPKGIITGFTITNTPGGINTEVYNLITEQIESGATTSLQSGFYRVAITNLENYNPDPTISGSEVTITHNENYYDYSLNEYNKAGQLTASYQPYGTTKATKPKSTFMYNALGQLLSTTSPDEGTANFKYRNDGQVRFSQNSKQKENNTFSYTTYDDLGRPTKSGVHPYSPTILNFDSLDPDLSVLNSVTDEMNITVYDSYENVSYKNPLSKTLDQALTDLGLTTTQKLAYKPSFLAGNVVITYTKSPETTTTWYSYDIYGRVKWIVQYINGLGTKTIDYDYDPVTSAVTKVDFQRYKTNERFIHKYTYNVVDELTKVETSTNDISFITHADYQYNETGALKRVEIAGGLQGIDYVYNLAGQLKAINHPELTSGKDSNGDVNDLFGMQLNYYKGDYLRANTNIASPAEGIDQYNGNIKSVSWNTKGLGTTTPDAYYYKYNKNNWLEGASFNASISDGSAGANITDFTQTWGYRDFITTSGGGGPASLKALNNTITFYYSAGFSNSIIKTGPVVKINYVVPDVDLGYLKVTKSTGEIYTDKFKVSIVSGWIVITAEGAYPSYLYKAMYSQNNTVLIPAGGGVAVDISATGSYNVYGITYDANGNIKKLNRNKNMESGSNAMDKFKYNYIAGKNQLSNVDDAVIVATGADDLKDQGVNNYSYNSIGQLTENASEGVKYFYNASGLVTEVSKNNIPLVKFFYNDKGQRVCKEVYNTSGTKTKTEYYVRDAAGSVLAIYNGTVQKELPIYGASRLGVFFKVSNSSVYQLTDHLGNVRAVIKKDAQNNAIASTATDYYPFGMPMPGRQIADGESRYAFQGQEKDPETGKEAFQLRLWDGRIGRWLTTDPAGQYSSPYLGMGNNPINGIDQDGGYWGWFDAAIGWASGMFKGSIDHVGGAGNRNYSITSSVKNENWSGDENDLLFTVKRDYGSDVIGNGLAFGDQLYNGPIGKGIIKDTYSIGLSSNVMAFFGSGSSAEITLLTRGESGIYFTPTVNGYLGGGVAGDAGFTFQSSTYTGDSRRIKYTYLGGHTFGGTAGIGDIFAGSLTIGYTPVSMDNPFGPKGGFISSSIQLGAGIGGFTGFSYQHTYTVKPIIKF